MMGSGTVAKMAIVHRRQFIGSEISEEYTKNALERIRPLLEQ
jgi:DNA modification methylase